MIDNVQLTLVVVTSFILFDAIDIYRITALQYISANKFFFRENIIASVRYIIRPMNNSVIMII